MQVALFIPSIQTVNALSGSIYSGLGCTGQVQSLNNLCSGECVPGPFTHNVGSLSVSCGANNLATATFYSDMQCSIALSPTVSGTGNGITCISASNPITVFAKVNCNAPACSDTSLPTGTLVGIIIGSSIAGLLLIFGIVKWCAYCRRQRTLANSNSVPVLYYVPAPLANNYSVPLQYQATNNNA